MCRNIYHHQEERNKREERERKKAEVRARLEAQASKPQKKGFMTGERKKKLRILLRRKAAEELKRQQEAKAAERRRVISERTGTKKNFDDLSEKELQTLCKGFHDRIKNLEGDKWDLEYAVGRKEIEVSMLDDIHVIVQMLTVLTTPFWCRQHTYRLNIDT